MQKCFVCKNKCRQLLMLTCSHDVCIKCAADSFLLKTGSHNQRKRQRKKQQKKQKREYYFCEICLEVTKIDEDTVRELREWCVMNVSAKDLRKVENRSKESKDGYQNNLMDYMDNDYEQKDYQIKSNRSPSANIQNKLRRISKIHEEYSNNQLFKFNQKKEKLQRVLSMNQYVQSEYDPYYQHFSSNPYQNVYAINERKSSSKEKLPFGSIIKRQVSRNEENMMNAKQKKSESLEGRIRQRRKYADLKSMEKKSCQNKKKQVYLDLIGFQHSLSEDELNVKEKDCSCTHKKPQIINKFAQKQYCNTHQDEQLIYYCLSCKILICSQCALYGKHKDHNIHTLKKAVFKLKQTLYSLLQQMNSYYLIQEQKQNLILEQIEQLKIQCSKQKQKVKMSFQSFLKNIQNKYSQVLGQLQESQSKALSGFYMELERTKEKCSQFLTKKTEMQNIIGAFPKNQTKNQLEAPIYNCDSMKNLLGVSTNASNKTRKLYKQSHRKYGQLDDFYDINSIISSQKNLSNVNIEEFQTKITSFEQYLKNLKPEYKNIVEPSLYVNESTQKGKRNSVQKIYQFRRPHKKSLRQSLELSETSLLIEPSRVKIKSQYKHFIEEQDFLQENNLNSLNFAIEKQLISSQFSQLKESIKLADVNTIVDSLKEIEQIIKELTIDFRIYDMKTKRKS